ncbi:Ankyrin repeat-containing protein [Fulvia fulva]|uniref:Ankyrin repeat-containing protein n=1 Tax=Passalora fulva TaxID=5499 RepID=A0A9Q8PAX3_PASFU|nr:Ankyrin repeat-containing protein [Fulvia fulva]KAK4622260.1 Ankyrin repeat-containing protein [Fulvia fulva]KAK4623343.1 Ankyrin repeat-containing protein [Fulvia fulva]UJO19066.1 Ankyrin repeat-containing protein [Fulvia fulva]WPV16164.1 Ankyrin repeat-containing protein [Fulvia fulva]WPV30880.1 Ankyrin repeat-containing protein [Fulvia fulva]
MHAKTPLALTFDEIDDLLHFTRANEVQDLEQTITELSQKYQCATKDVLEAAVDAETGNTVLHFCSANGLAELLPVLSNKLGQTSTDNTNGASQSSKLVNHGNREGNTPLHWAAYNGHLAVVKLLIAAGADMWVKNAAGHLAMFEAERAEKDDVVQYLLEVGGKDVETGGSEGQASAEDVADVQDGEAESSASAQASAGAGSGP